MLCSSFLIAVSSLSAHGSDHHFKPKVEEIRMLSHMIDFVFLMDYNVPIVERPVTPIVVILCKEKIGKGVTAPVVRRCNSPPFT